MPSTSISPEDLADFIRRLPGSVLRIRGTYTPAIRSRNGVAEYRSIEINGHPQRLLIRGHDVSKPVLLYIPGGPGESNIWVAHRSMRRLEKHFVCVNWDPRGAPKSLQPPPPAKSMRIQQFVDDTIALIELLLKRFGHKKLLLVGHSWGSVLAMKVAAARPDLLYAVVGMGQVVDNKRGEELSYEYVLERARADRNRKAIRELEALGGSDTYSMKPRFVERLWLMHYGGLTHSGGLMLTVRVMLEAPEFSFIDCVRYMRMEAMKFSIPLLGNELRRVNLLREIRELSIPVFIFEGRHDYTAPSVLAEEFYKALKAPHKRLVWFENSGHPPDFEEPDKFQRELIAIGAEFCSIPRQTAPRARSQMASRAQRSARRSAAAAVSRRPLSGDASTLVLM
jgi:pimeloyl-ACP methyl ester carboxylesterase